MPVLVFLDKAHTDVPGFTDTGDNIYCCRFFRIKGNPIPDSDDRIEHRAFAARECTGPGHRLWVGNGVSAADEPQAIGLIGNFAGFRPVDGHQMKHPRRVLVVGAGAAGAEDRLPLIDDLRLDKKIAERRMQRVCGRRSKHDLRVTRDLDLSACPAAVGDRDPAQLDIILGRNSDLGVRVKVVVPAAKLGAAFRENRLIILRAFERRLICG